ncbi:SUN domain-containing ossification factor [Liparis tanakae]|uniref:SUN domain-containing ossification factor n=1 Tax=Liparis tanakae TaxID=230148 RepID=A0A4Z2IW72_9TELE|nr:SUN domain-containing ossification factor [Liparis tanakae]
MKMKPLLRIVVSVWLCFTVVCRYPSCYVGCTESHQEAQRPVGPEEESGEKSHHQKMEENRVFLTQSLSEKEQLIMDDQQMEERTTQEAFEGEEPAVEEELEADKITSQPEPESQQSSENQHPETSITPDQDSASLLPSSHSYTVRKKKLKKLKKQKKQQNKNKKRITHMTMRGTQTQSDPPLTSQAQHLEDNASYVPKEQDLSSHVTKGAVNILINKDPNDIPTFDEWTRKMMEVENEKTQSTHNSNNGAPPTVKKVQKNFNNYASVECGAKILGSNPEAKSTSAVLWENRDMYMLNPCSNKIWFIIELCEPIQLKQLDIANFELFSSTPKDFLVFISDRYPTNKWLKLGTFHGRDERTVQSFPLDEQLYAKYVKMFTKYIKVELVSHFGAEHFCPLSLIRVFGTSMVEEYEEIADPTERTDDQDDDLDVIYNMVNNIAVNVLGGGSELQDSEVEEMFPEPNIPVAPSSDASETSTADTSKHELPQPQPHGSEVQQELEAASKRELESKARLSETPLPPGNSVGSHKASLTEPPLEPSQASNLPKPSATDSSAAKPTPIVQTPRLSFEEPKAEKSQDVLAEEKHIEPSASLSSSISVKPKVNTAVDDASQEKSDIEVSVAEISRSMQTADKTDQSQVLHPTASPQLEHHPDPPAMPKRSTASSEVSHPAPDTITDLEPSGGHSAIAETKSDDFAEDASTSSGGKPSSSTSPSSPTLSDIYAEPPNGTDQNGNTVHGSSQKESVFMRLNNRIKALEINMSLSGRYLEQLSQRYRKQMEEMQKAFNQTVIKLQNTSRIAEEQDQRQTESIQLLQGQLENCTRLVVNLSVRVSQLQDEVSDRHNYLLLSLGLCVCLGLLLCANHGRVATLPPTTGPEPPAPKSYTYCCPERQFSSVPEMLHAEETQSLCPANRKRRRRKMNPNEKEEALELPVHAAPEPCNRVVFCNGVPVTTNPTPLTKMLLQPLFRDSPSDGSSEGSSHSDDPSFCGITTACNRICDGLPPPKTRAEKRAFRRGRPRPSCAGVDLLPVPRRDRSQPVHISTIQDIMNRKSEQSSGTFGVNVALSGPV